MKKLLFAVLILLALSLCACTPRPFAKEYIVTYDVDGATSIQIISDMNLNSAPIPQKEGFVFEGWYETADYSGKMVEFPYLVTKNLYFYAKFIDWNVGNEELSFTLSDDGNSYSVTSYTGTSVNVVIPPAYKGLPVTKVTLGFLKNNFYLTQFYFTSVLANIEEVFYYCPNFSEFVKKDDGGNYDVIDGVLYGDEGTTLICYPPAKPDSSGARATEFTFIDDIKKVERNAFRNAAYLKTISLNASLETIDINFSAMSSLENINVGLNSAFYSDKGVLYSGDKKTLICFPPSNPYTEYSLLEQTLTVSEGAFENSGIVTIKLNSALTEFGTAIELNKLKSIEAPYENAYFSTIGGVLFDKSGETLIKYPQAKEGEEYTVPEGVEIIASYAFRGVNELKKVTIAATVKRVNEYAFSGDGSSVLAEAEFSQGSVLEFLAGSAFAGCDKFRSLRLSCRKPPNTGITALNQNVSEIYVPFNVIELFNSEWKSVSGKIFAANYSVKTFKVDFSAEGAEVESIDAACISKEPIPVREGYVFNGWYTSESSEGNRVLFPYAVESDITLYALWVKIQSN